MASVQAHAMTPRPHPQNRIPSRSWATGANAIMGHGRNANPPRRHKRQCRQRAAATVGIAVVGPGYVGLVTTACLDLPPAAGAGRESDVAKWLQATMLVGTDSTLGRP